MSELVKTRSPRSAAWLQYLSLFSSFGTLVCCALPSLFVLAGLGATVASVLSAAPWLVALSRHKNWTFAIAGLLIVTNIVYLRVLAPRLKGDECAADAGACDTAARVNNVLLWVTATIYAFGFFVAYLLGPILTFLDHSQ
jgi:mercuric ion transport protein